jgi:hypothetical protein
MFQAFFYRVAEADGKNNGEDLKHKKILMSLQASSLSKLAAPSSSR